MKWTAAAPDPGRGIAIDGGPGLIDGGPGQIDGGPGLIDGGPGLIGGGPGLIGGGPLTADGMVRREGAGVTEGADGMDLSIVMTGQTRGRMGWTSAS